MFVVLFNKYVTYSFLCALSHHGHGVYAIWQGLSLFRIVKFAVFTQDQTMIGGILDHLRHARPGPCRLGIPSPL